MKSLGVIQNFLIYSRNHFFGLSLLVLSLASSSLFAGGLSRILVDSNGTRISVANAIASDTPLPLRIKNECGILNSGACFKWRIASTNANAASLYKAQIDAAFAPWIKTLGSAISITYDGVQTSLSSKDASGNDLSSGDFIIALPATMNEVPAEISFGSSNAYAVTKITTASDLANSVAEVKWAGIYLNPSRSDYSITNILAEQIGRILGLQTSIVTSSLLYSQRDRKVAVGADLAAEDRLWISSLYSPSSIASTTGILSGQMINGLDGSAWIGAHIGLIPAKSRAAFASSRDRDLSIEGTYSLENGNFKFPAVDPGDYLLIAEAINTDPLSLNLFDDFLQKFGNTNVFDTEFYDGKIRESNKEAALSALAQSVLYAATVTVVAGKETSGVQIITNQADPNVKLISAAGSSSESLSAQLPPGLEAAVQAIPSSSSTGGGCGLQMDAAAQSSGNLVFIFIFLSLGFALCLRAQVRRDLKVK